MKMNGIYLGDGINNCKLCGNKLADSDHLRKGKCNDICQNCHKDLFGILKVLKIAKDEGRKYLTIDEISIIRHKEKLIKSKPSRN